MLDHVPNGVCQLFVCRQADPRWKTLGTQLGLSIVSMHVAATHVIVDHVDRPPTGAEVRYAALQDDGVMQDRSPARPHQDAHIGARQRLDPVPIEIHDSSGICPSGEGRRLCRQMSALEHGRVTDQSVHNQRVRNHPASGGEHRQPESYLDQDPSAARIAFGLRLRRVRMERGLTQEELAYRTNLHTTAVGRFERGVREPRLTTILRLARGLEVLPSALLDDLRWPETGE
jgi:DNA-binding XRE family transcriptional regulator